jgi:hypothetical protein
MPRPTPEPSLSAGERDRLTTRANRPKSSQRLALRPRIVRACADEPRNTAVAARVEAGGATAGTWRTRFVADRLDGLVDDPRPGPPRTATAAGVARVVTETLAAPPANATHRGTRGRAAATGMPHSAISQIWRAFGVTPYRGDTPEPSTDPSFVEKVGRDPAPPEKALVLSVDEGSQVQALDRTHRRCR